MNNLFMGSCGKHKGSLYKKLEKFTDWFTLEDPAEEYIFTSILSGLVLAVL